MINISSFFNINHFNHHTVIWGKIKVLVSTLILTLFLLLFVNCLHRAISCYTKLSWVLSNVYYNKKKPPTLLLGVYKCKTCKNCGFDLPCQSTNTDLRFLSPSDIIGTSFNEENKEYFGVDGNFALGTNYQHMHDSQFPITIT